MILDQFLNESSYGLSNIPDVEPIVESWMTGDPNELFQISNENASTMRKLDENVMLAESLAYVAEMRGNAATAIKLQEGVIGDFFEKVKEAIKKLWAKVKGFFVNLFKSIAVSVGDVKKSLDGIDKYLKKDFSKFKYDGYAWKSPDIGNTLSNNANQLLDATEAVTNTIINNAKKDIASKADAKDVSDWKMSDESQAERNAYSGLLGKTGEITLEQATDAIKEMYGCDGSKEEIKNFSATSAQNMVAYLKSFNKNKTLNDLKTKTDKNYKNALTNTDKIKKQVEEIKVEDGEGASNSRAIINKAISRCKNQASTITRTLNCYNNLMGVAIRLEKAKFKEYRTVIASAVRYNDKKHDNDEN